MKLFLDDLRKVRDVFSYTSNDIYLDTDWEIVKSYDEFKNYIDNNPLPEIISFDHDLADEHYNEGKRTNFEEFDYNNCREKTGYDCAKYLLQYCLDNEKKLPICLIHTQNPIGKENIKAIFSQFDFLKNMV